MKIILAAGIAVLAIAALGPTVALAQQRTDCTSSELSQEAAHLVDGKTSPLFGGTISVLDGPLNSRRNSYYHTTNNFEGILKGYEYPCVADIVTNHDLMTMYYGKKVINEKTYVVAKLMPKSDDEDDGSNSAANPSAGARPTEPAKLSWAEVLPQVKLKCAQDWQNDYNMQAYCIKEQHDGWVKINGDGPSPAIQQTPIANPPSNYTVSPLSPPATVDTPSASVTLPSPALVAPPVPPAVAKREDADFLSFQKGKSDRMAWETFFGSIVGDEHDGALWWAGQRSLKAPGSCSTASNDQRRRGCEEAQAILGPSDVLRKTNPAYRSGWNSL